MRRHDPDKLGDEPLYCEAQHDEALFSGSEDDYYEAPECRRIRIEAKAVQFLNGDVPYLLSAQLKGPFDAKSWNNPWRSRRAQRRPVLREDQARRSQTTVEVARCQNSEDITDTQRTSLYPLPSPEITNPPSARKNSFMDEEEYNRIKKWRETIKSVPVANDPFWAPEHERGRKAPAARKRSADQAWIHKRDPKRRKSVRLTMPPEESPSQAAARTKRKLISQVSELVTAPAPGCSTHDDALAAPWNATVASDRTSRMANVPERSPSHAQTMRGSPSSRKPCRLQNSESSEDELSLPSTTPNRKASRTSAEKFQASAARRSPSKKQKSVVRSSSSHAQRRTNGDSVQVGQMQGSHLSKTRQLGLERAARLAKDAARKVIISSQRDDSFCFHHARLQSPAQQPENQHQLANGMDGTTMSLAPLQAQASSPLMCDPSEGREGDHVQKDGANEPAHAGDEMVIDTSGQQNSTHTGVAELKGNLGAIFAAERPIDQAAMDTGLQVVDDGLVHESPKEVETKTAQRCIEESDEVHVGPEAGRLTLVCTQQLSPISMRGKSQSGALASTVAEERIPLPTVYSADDANPEWSTYINTQDLSAVSEKSPSAGRNDGDGSDPEWSTYVNTQDLSDLSEGAFSHNPASAGIDVVLQGPDDPNHSEWVTFVNTQGTTAESAVEQEKVVVEDEMQSDSEWSTYMSASSQIKVDQTGNTSHEYIPAATTAASDTKYSQVSVGSIIDAYADDHHTGEDFDGDQECLDMGQVHQADKMVISCGEDKARPESLSEVDSPEADELSVSTVDPSERQSMTSMPTEQLEKYDQGVALSRGDEETTLSAKEPGESQLSFPVSGSQLKDVEVLAMTERPNGISTIDLDGTTASLEPTQSQSPRVEEVGDVSQVPMAPGYGAGTMQDFGIVDPAAVGSEPRPLQSPWHNEDGPYPRATTTPLEPPVIFERADVSIESQQIQSPWTKAGQYLPTQGVLDNNTTLDESSSRLSTLAGEALAFSATPQNSWFGDKLPSPDFSLSVKKFSDFMKLSPEKKRASASASASILRGSASCSRLLFETPVAPKSKRRVKFAPLPGEEVGIDSKDSDVYEEVSYFDPIGTKTNSLRVARPTARAASPPPSNVNVADAGQLPDHDQKFAKHFEVMSKRKKQPSRRKPRLLPNDSQQTNGSQKVDAMAEAFIQASQIRKQGLELTQVSAGDNAQNADLSVEKNSSSMAMDGLEEQENKEPVDDVSAVLDNIGDFLDNTWGVDLSMDANADQMAPPQPQVNTAPSRFDNEGIPMMALDLNVWAG